MKICAPAFIYMIFSLTQIIIDTIKGLYNTAFLKFIVSILITILLDGLCKGGMGLISWIIVFIPFIFMTVIVTILLYVFGLDMATGQLNISCVNDKTNGGGNLIFSNDNNNNNNNTTTIKHVELNPDHVNQITSPIKHPYLLSTDPQYES